MSDDDTRSFEDVRDGVTGEHPDLEPQNRKHTTGRIDGHGFSLSVDGDAPDALVADIEAALATVKQERES